MAFSYVVIGLGAQGPTVVYDLIVYCDAFAVYACEPDPVRRGEARRLLATMFSDIGRGHLIHRVCILEDLPDAYLMAVQAMLCCSPHTTIIEWMKVALRFGIPFLDLGGSQTMLDEQKRVAKGALSPVVCARGVAPGIVSDLGIHAAQLGSTIVTMRCGGNPLKCPDPAANPLRYKLMYSIDGLVEGYCAISYSIRSGDLLASCGPVAARMYDTVFEWHPTAHIPLDTFEILQRLGVKRATYGTLRYPGHHAALFEGLPRPVTATALREKLCGMPAIAFHSAHDRDRLTIAIDGMRMQKGKRVPVFSYYRDLKFDEVTRCTAMARATAMGITIPAHLIAKREIAVSGLVTSEVIVDGPRLMKEIDRRLLSCDEKR